MRDGRAVRESGRAGADAGKEYLEARTVTPTVKQVQYTEQRLVVATKNLRELGAEDK